MRECIWLSARLLMLVGLAWNGWDVVEALWDKDQFLAVYAASMGIGCALWIMEVDLS